MGKTIYFSTLQYSIIPVFQCSSVPTFSELASGMISLMDLLQPFPCDMGINLRCGDIHMTQHHLTDRRSAPLSRRWVAKECRSK